MGTGGASIRHCCEVGEIFGSDVFQRKPRFEFVETVCFPISTQTKYNRIDGRKHLSTQLFLLGLRAGQSEAMVHAAALRNGLNMHAELSHFAIPLCTDPDEGTVEMISWPFLLPSTMDS